LDTSEDKKLNFYMESLYPHIVLHTNILKNTQTVITSLCEALWKPIYKASLVEKKQNEITVLVKKSKFMCDIY